MTVTIYVPCDVFSVQVQLGYDDKLSEIEQIVLRAVYHHPELRGLEELSAALNLGRPLTMDIAFDLMRRRYALIDFAKGTMRPAPGIEKRIVDGTLADLPGAETVDDRKLVMVDVLSGHTLAATGRHEQPARQALIIPVESGNAELAEVSQTELLNAINRTLDAEYGDLLRTSAGHGAKARGRRLRALSAHLGPQDRKPIGKRRWLEIRVTPSKNPSGQGLLIRIEDDTLPAARRAIAEARLQQMSVDQPDNDFIRRLDSQADRRPLRSYTFEDRLTSMHQLLVKAETAAPGSRRKRHRELVYVATRAWESLAAETELEMHAHPVYGRAAVLDQVRRLMRLATRQIVLASPEADDKGLEILRPEIEEAAAKGVRVVVLWGRRHRQQLPDPARNLLYQFNREHQVSREHQARAVVWCERSSRINTSLAIADDRAAVVANGSILYRGGGRGTQIGATLRARDDAAGCYPIEQLLAASRRSFPDPVLGAAIAVRHDDLHQAAPGAPVAEPATGPEGIPGLPDERDDIGGGQIRAWAAAWRLVIDSLAKARDRSRLPEVRVVAEDEHRDLLWSALHGAEKRLVIGSRLARATVVSNGFEEAARRRLEADAPLVILARRPERADPADGVLSRLASAHPGRYTELAERAVDGGLLIGDEDVLVTGFDLLTDGAGRARREWSTIGVRIRSRDFANAVARLTADQRDVAGNAEPVETEQPTPEQTRAAVLAHRLTITGEEDPDPETIRRILGETTDEWAVLAQMRKLELSSAVLRTATLVALKHCPSLDDEQPQFALRWLVHDLWRKRSFMEAALLRDAVSDVAWSPRRSLAAVAATRADPWFVTAYEQAVLGGDGPGSHEAVALALTGAAALLTGLPVPDPETALNDIDQVLECLPDQSGAVGTLVSATRRHFEDVRGALPLAAIRKEQVDALDEQSAARDWDALAEALEKAAHFSFDFNVGTRTHSYLFQSDQAFGALTALIPDRRPEALRGWLAEYDVRNLGRLLDLATKAANGPREQIVARRRARYLERLAAVTKLVVRLAPLTGITQPEADADRRIAAQVVGKTLAAEWDGLHEVVDKLGIVEGTLARAALSTLEDIYQWAS
ncbi:hypothetical protein L083_5747 [Actinoplanes sp. N902-109]|nr:hypothetical protein L083_5747 [Actinoplanes sp. N902-109]